MTIRTKDMLEARIAELTAGADSTPVEEGVERTPGQFIHWFLELPEAERLRVVERIYSTSREASDCFLCDHKGRLEWLEEQRGVRDRALAQWLIAEARWEAFQDAAAIVEGAAL